MMLHWYSVLCNNSKTDVDDKQRTGRPVRVCRADGGASETGHAKLTDTALELDTAYSTFHVQMTYRKVCVHAG